MEVVPLGGNNAQSSARLGLGRCPTQVLLREHPAFLPSLCPLTPHSPNPQESVTLAEKQEPCLVSQKVFLSLLLSLPSYPGIFFLLLGGG